VHSRDAYAYFSLKPVDKELCDAYDYNLVIGQPMDFETLQNNLRQNKYLTISEFISDVELIFINAKIYNPPHHSVHKAAENLQKMFKLKFHSIIDEYGDDETNLHVNQNIVETEIVFNYSTHKNRFYTHTFVNCSQKK